MNCAELQARYYAKETLFPGPSHSNSNKLKQKRNSLLLEFGSERMVHPGLGLIRSGSGGVTEASSDSVLLVSVWLYSAWRFVAHSRQNDH